MAATLAPQHTSPPAARTGWDDARHLVGHASTIAFFVQAAYLWHATYGAFLPTETQSMGPGAGEASSRFILLMLPAFIATMFAWQPVISDRPNVSTSAWAGLGVTLATAAIYLMLGAPVTPN